MLFSLERMLHAVAELEGGQGGMYYICLHMSPTPAMIIYVPYRICVNNMKGSRYLTALR